MQFHRVPTNGQKHVYNNIIFCQICDSNKSVQERERERERENMEILFNMAIAPFEGAQ